MQRLLEEMFIEALPELCGEKKEWTITEIMEKLGLNVFDRDRLIKTLQIMQYKNSNLVLEKSYHHGLGYVIKFK